MKSTVSESAFGSAIRRTLVALTTLLLSASFADFARASAEAHPGGASRPRHFIVTAPTTWIPVVDDDVVVYRLKGSSTRQTVTLQRLAVETNHTGFRFLTENRKEIEKERQTFFRQFGLENYAILGIEESTGSDGQKFQSLRAVYSNASNQDVQIFERQYSKGATLFRVTYSEVAQTLNDRGRVDRILENFKPNFAHTSRFPSSEASGGEALAGSGAPPPITPPAATQSNQLNQSDQPHQAKTFSENLVEKFGRRPSPELCKDVPKDVRFDAKENAALGAMKGFFIDCAWKIVKGALQVLSAAGEFVFNSKYRDQVFSAVAEIKAEIWNDKDGSFAAKAMGLISESLGRSLPQYQCLNLEKKVEFVCSTVVDAAMMYKLFARLPLIASQQQKLNSGLQALMSKIPSKAKKPLTAFSHEKAPPAVTAEPPTMNKPKTPDEARIEKAITTARAQAQAARASVPRPATYGQSLRLSTKFKTLQSQEKAIDTLTSEFERLAKRNPADKDLSKAWSDLLDFKGADRRAIALAQEDPDRLLGLLREFGRDKNGTKFLVEADKATKTPPKRPKPPTKASALTPTSLADGAREMQRRAQRKLNNKGTQLEGAAGIAFQDGTISEDKANEAPSEPEATTPMPPGEESPKTSAAIEPSAADVANATEMPVAADRTPETTPATPTKTPTKPAGPEPALDQPIVSQEAAAADTRETSTPRQPTPARKTHPAPIARVQIRPQKLIFAAAKSEIRSPKKLESHLKELARSSAGKYKDLHKAYQKIIKQKHGDIVAARLVASSKKGEFKKVVSFIQKHRTTDIAHLSKKKLDLLLRDL